MIEIRLDVGVFLCPPCWGYGLQQWPWMSRGLSMSTSCLLPVLEKRTFGMVPNSRDGSVGSWGVLLPIMFSQKDHAHLGLTLGSTTFILCMINRTFIICFPIDSCFQMVDYLHKFFLKKPSTNTRTKSSRNAWPSSIGIVWAIQMILRTYGLN